MGLFDKSLAANSLDDLNKQWSDCRKCPLRIGDTKICPGLGQETAKVMIVGQSPTKTEAAYGVMLQDRGGQEIRQWFERLAGSWGMNPGDLYFTNICKCPSIIRQNSNKPVAFIDEKGKAMETAVPAKMCGRYLEEEIKLIRPKLIVSIGQIALQRFSAADTFNKIPKKLDMARKRLLSYSGTRFAAVTMPTRLSEDDFELKDDEEFLRQIFTMKQQKYIPKRDIVSMKSIEANFKDVVECKSCSLAETSHCRVYGTGNTQADILFVGESPGQKEDETGVPFSGPSGMLFRECLDTLNIDYRDIYITNAIKCWPGSGNPTPTEDQVGSCLSYLQIQIKNIKPKVIITMGAVALKAVTKLPRRVGPVRGRPQKCFFSEAAVIPTWHPSYILRDLKKKSRDRSPVFKEFMKDLIAAQTLIKEQK